MSNLPAISPKTITALDEAANAGQLTVSNGGQFARALATAQAVNTLRDLLTVDPALWKQEVAGIREFYAKFGDKLPKKLRDELDALEKRL